MSRNVVTISEYQFIGPISLYLNFFLNLFFIVNSTFMNIDC